MKKNKFRIKYIDNILYTVLVIVLLWIGVSSFIQRIKCPSMTETEIFLHIPKSVMCDWTNCKISH